MADIFGTATIAYIPDGKIVGLSKLSRLLEMHARRLQVQERLTNDIAEDLFKHLQCKAAGVIINARHMCMESRGVCQQGHYTRTLSTKGTFKTDPVARAEFLSLGK
jgi:GTP cyclohydrolase I